MYVTNKDEKVQDLYFLQYPNRKNTKLYHFIKLI